MADRTPDEIEREIEAERAALTRSLDALQREFSPDVLIDKARAKLREHGGSAAETALRQARQNPMAMAVTGLGLAWLAAGPATSRRRAIRLPPPDSARGIPSTPQFDVAEDYRVGSGSRSDQAYGTPTSRRSNPAFDRRPYEQAHGFRETRDPMAGFDDRLARASGDATDPTVKERIGDAMASAKEKLMSLKTRLADAAHDPKTAARELRDYLSEGTDQMSESTRDRVIAARRAAWDAEKRLEAHARDYAQAGREFYGSQPLIGGLVAFGLGAAIGAALPRTRQEDHYLGSYRDRAMDEAERYYRSESERLRGVAENAVEEAKRMASETLDNVVSEAKGEGSKDSTKDYSSGSTSAGKPATGGTGAGGMSSTTSGSGSSAGSTGSSVGSSGSSAGSTGGTANTTGKPSAGGTSKTSGTAGTSGTTGTSAGSTTSTR